MIVTAQGYVEIIDGDEKHIEFGWSCAKRQGAQANEEKDERAEACFHRYWNSCHENQCKATELFRVLTFPVVADAMESALCGICQSATPLKPGVNEILGRFGGLFS
jgi:hypothetical protein